MAKRQSKLLTTAAEESFEYVVKRMRRKTIALHVLPDGTVEVRAPKWVSGLELAGFVEEKAAWVLKQRREVLFKAAQRPDYALDEAHYFLGERFPLTVNPGQGSGVDLRGQQLLVTERDSRQPELLERQLWRWYRLQAAEVFEERLFACYESFPEWFQDKFPMPELKIRKMRRRWGSCTSSGVVTLNLVLIKMPIECIDYVICHELCHLEVFNHGRSFYRLLAAVLPEWRTHEQQIEHLADRI